MGHADNNALGDLDIVAELLQDKESKTVEQYLNLTDYTADPEYVPSDFALSFVNFIKMMMDGEGEENETPIVHYRMLDGLVSGDNRLINMCHRGLGKTTLFAELLIFYLAVYGYLPNFGKVDFILYVSDSIDNGVKSLRKNLEFRWENSEFLQKYLPSVKWTDIRYEFTNADGNKFVVKAFGAKTGVRGTKEMGRRPQMALLDDLISDEDARSDTVIASIEDTVYKAIEYALHPKQNMIVWSGTPFNARDPLYKAVESGAWNVNVFPVCEKFPCKRAEFRSSWPDRFTYDYVVQQYVKAYKGGKIDTFDQEMMLRIMSDADRLIPDNCLLWYSLSTLLDSKANYNFYITTDIATSEKQSADFTVLSVWAYNHNGDWFYVDGICVKQTLDKSLDDLFKLVSRWNPQSVGIEISGQQQGFVSLIQRQMMERSIFFMLASDKKSGEAGIRPITDKLQRFGGILPIISARKMYFPHELKATAALIEAMEELRLAAKGGFRSKHDDFLDTISMLADMEPWKPSGETDYDVAEPLPDNRYFPSMQIGGDYNDQPHVLDNYIV